MSLSSSYQSIAEQIINYNKNVVDLLSSINKLITSDESTSFLTVTDSQGVPYQINLPSFSNIQSQIDRMNNNIKSIYGLGDGATLIQTSGGQFKKIVTVDLNKEPLDIQEIDNVNTFVAKKNWFFETLLNPMLSIEIDLSGKISDNTRKCLSRRYIVEFQKFVSGALTPEGQSALVSFDSNFRGKNNILIEDFKRWLDTTPGITTDTEYDEEIIDLEPNSLLYDGVFSVLKIEEDTINRKLWYHLNTLEYFNTKVEESKQLTIGDELIINVLDSATRYKIVEISTSGSNPRVRLNRIEGLDPIPVGTNTLKYYSPVFWSKKLRVGVGFNERSVLFIKPINDENNIMSRKWSVGVGFWTNDLKLNSDDSDKGTFFEQYYINKVLDYGEVLNELVSKKIPTKNSNPPAVPQLDPENFKVVQINRHLTDSVDSNELRNRYAQQKSLKSEIDKINDSIVERNRQLRVVRFNSQSDRRKFENEISRLIQSKESKTSLLRSNINEILNISNNIVKKEGPKYRIRGFWPIPLATVSRGNRPQEVIQFRIQYRYLSVDGKETPIETFNLIDKNSRTNESLQKRASYSNWEDYKTDVRKRVFDSTNNRWIWQIEDVSDADTPNINQIDIPIRQGEKVQIRIKSISEAGWPDSPLESDWSSILTVDFPEDLSDVLNESEFILKQADKEDLIVSMQNEFSARGIDEHLSETVVLSDKTYYHTTDKILSGFRDQNGNAIDLFNYLQSLELKIKSLEEKIARTKGELQVIIYRNNDEFIIKNGSEISFNVECEDYLDPFTSTGIPTGRVYANNIYVIRDFLLKIKNKSTTSPLGLLSSRNYTPSDIYNSQAPQVFWINDQNELITSDTTGTSQTQVNNQFIWSVNFDSINQTTSSVKLSDNIGNVFSVNNSITDVLSSIDFNVGYSENSILNFIGSNRSLLDPQKWIENTISVSSETKLLTTVHPMVPSLSSIIETNQDKIKSISGEVQDDINIPLPIYFKMNSLDNITNTGLNYQYINLNNSTSTIKHVKKIKFLLETENDNRPFVFTVKFNINRNKIVVVKNKQLGITPNISASSQEVNITR